MLKIRLNVALVILGKHCPAGSEVEVKDTLARRLVALGHATFVVDAPQFSAPETAVVTGAERAVSPKGKKG